MVRLAFLALALLPGFAPQDKVRYREALSYYSRNGSHNIAFRRARAVEFLGETTYEKVDKRTLNLVLLILKAELARGKGGKSENRVSGDVLEACLLSLRRIRAPKALNLMIKIATLRGAYRFRWYVIAALGATKYDKAHETLTDLARDKSPFIQIAALDALAEAADAKSLPLFVEVVSDRRRSWELKVAALRGIENQYLPNTALCLIAALHGLPLPPGLEKSAAKDDKEVDSLIAALGNLTDDQGRIKVALMRILNIVLATDITSDEVAFWNAAWTRIKRGDKIGVGGTVADPTEFFGLKTKSTRLVFVLDRTGSMREFGGAPEREDWSREPPKVPRKNGRPDPRERAARARATMLKRDIDNRPVRTRMDGLLREYVGAIYYLDPRVRFTTIWYEGNPTAWNEALVPATWQNKLAALKYAERLSPGGGTDLWEAVEMAFKMVAPPRRPDAVQLNRKANYATVINGADTLFVMSDGRPTIGRIHKPEAILSELRKVNRIRKVIIHTICFGSDSPGLMEPPDPGFLRDMAAQNGGQFRHVRN